jgi:hypothetical protein
VDDYTCVPWLSGDSKHSVVCIQFYQRAARHLRCVVESKALQYQAVDSNANTPDSNETFVHLI